ncbi:hypothetical protein ES705_14131 [subsurface metagenome]
MTRIHPVMKIYALLVKYHIKFFSYSEGFKSVMIKYGINWNNIIRRQKEHSLIMYADVDGKGAFDDSFILLLNKAFKESWLLKFLDDMLDVFIITNNIENFEYNELKQILVGCEYELTDIEQMKFWKNEATIKAKVEIKIEFQDIIQDINRNFRKIVKTKPQKERDVQDYLETFFDVKEYDFIREKEKVGFSDKAFEPNFTHKDLNITVEVKFVDRPEKKKSIIDEMSADIKPYSKNWKNILFLVYDVNGNIRDVDSYVRDFIQDGEITIRCIVIKH